MWRSAKRSLFYTRMAYAPSSYRYGATVLLVMGMAGLVVSGRYNGVGMFLSKAEKKVNKLQAQCHESAALRRECIRLKESIHTLNSELTSYAAALGTGDRMLDFFARAQRGGIALDSCSVSREIEKGWYTNRRVQLGFTGSFSQAIAFFKSLQREGSLAQCHDVTMMRASGDQFKTSCAVKLRIIDAEKTLQLRTS